MTDDEARRTLEVGGDQAAKLISSARGWPAVIGLAAAVPAARHPSIFPPTLFEFLAAELFDNLDEGVKEALRCLSSSPSGSPEDAMTLAGAGGGSMVGAAVVAGFLPATPETTELHPLLRAFLRNKLSQTPELLQTAASTLVDLYLEHGRWDDAFQVATEAGSRSLALEILDGAFDRLLAEGRIATLALWLQALDDYEPARALLDLGAAELAFREGLHDKAHRLAIEASRGFDSD